MEVCYWALLFMPIVILLYLYSLQIKGVSQKKKKKKNYREALPVQIEFTYMYVCIFDRICGLVVRVLGYRSRGMGSIPGATRFSEK
jgi:hypothetical protein